MDHFDESIVGNLRLFPVGGETRALQLPPLRLLVDRVKSIETVRCPRSLAPALAQTLPGDGSRTSKRLRLKAMAWKKAAN